MNNLPTTILTWVCKRCGREFQDWRHQDLCERCYKEITA